MWVATSARGARAELLVFPGENPGFGDGTGSATFISGDPLCMAAHVNMNTSEIGAQGRHLRELLLDRQQRGFVHRGAAAVGEGVVRDHPRVAEAMARQ
jgi:hypothetical protein